MTFHNGEVGEVSLWNDEEGFYFDAVRASGYRCLMNTHMLTFPLSADLVGSGDLAAAADPQLGRSHSALRDAHSRAVDAQEVPRLQEAHGVVHREPPEHLEAQHCQHVRCVWQCFRWPCFL